MLHLQSYPQPPAPSTLTDTFWVSTSVWLSLHSQDSVVFTVPKLVVKTVGSRRGGCGVERKM